MIRLGTRLAAVFVSPSADPADFAGQKKSDVVGYFSLCGDYRPAP